MPAPMPSIAVRSPQLENYKLLTFTHETDEGFLFYHVMVPGDYEAPKGTIGGQQDVDETPELWIAFQKFIVLLGIEFDPENEKEFLWCSEEPCSDIPVADRRVLS